MYEAGTFLAIAAILSAGAGIYSATQAGKGLAVPPPPTPASAYTYSEDGSVTMQRWDAERNAYITEYDPEPTDPSIIEWKWWRQHVSVQGLDEMGITANEFKGMEEEERQAKYNEWVSKRNTAYKSTPEYKAWQAREEKRQAEAKLRGDLEKQYLQFLDKPPAERVRMYEKYQKTFSDVMHTEVDRQYNDRMMTIKTDMEKQGMTGSKAYTDVIGELNEEKARIDTDIEQKSIMAKETLAQADQSTALNVLNYLSQSGSAEHAKRMGEASISNTNAAAGTAATMGKYASMLNTDLMKWKAEQEMGSKMMDTAGGLAYLYGYNRPGGSIISPSKSPYAATAGNYILGGKDYSSMIKSNY